MKCTASVDENKLLIISNIYFSDVPPDVTAFTITVHNTGKRGKESEVHYLIHEFLLI